jgi:hypothetical protein
MEFNSNNLLSFVNSASSNIQEALNKAPKRRRNVTVKKFVENRVTKRLDSSRRVRTSFNRSKSAQLKRSATTTVAPATVIPMLQHSTTCPEFNSPDPLPLPPVQSAGLPTSAYPTTATPSSLYAAAAPEPSNVCLSPQQPAQPIDPELESLLSELEGSLSRHGSFDSVCTGTLSSTPPINNLETQVYLGEQMFSPYSDYSDELDSAYCSPVEAESTRVSYNSSPMPSWVEVADMLPAVTSSCMQDMEMVSSRCNWESTPLITTTATSTSSSSLSSVYDQGPPMTPTVSQLLQQYNQY